MMNLTIVLRMRKIRYMDPKKNCQQMNHRLLKSKDTMPQCSIATEGYRFRSWRNIRD